MRALEIQYRTGLAFRDPRTMPRKTTPKYRLHKARNCAVVTISGRDHYLGAYDSPESWEQYHRLVAEHLAERREPPPPVSADTPSPSPS